MASQPKKPRRWLRFAVAVPALALAGHFANAELQTFLSKWRKSLPEEPLVVPSRSECISQLKNSEAFDMLVIGGGATGAGIALDAVTRGLKTAMVEKDDFCSGTSSRSTKLLHGGIRYLEKAFWNLDYSQLHLVYEALSERATLLHLAPHLSNAVPILIPVYSLLELPYLWVGAKMYDIVAGAKTLFPSRYANRAETLESFPLLNKEKLVGYYDGQHNDARMGLSAALTAAAKGAAVANHCAVTALLKENGKIVGATLQDSESGESWDVRAKVVVNATGPFTDAILKMDDPSTQTTISPSAGVHIVLPDFYSSPNMGMIIPKTKDGRVLFMLPWERHTLAGTTDVPTDVTSLPAPKEADVAFIIDELSRVLSMDVRREDVLASWSGIRPLARDPTAADTQSISRDHVIWTTPSGLVNIAGGKWTTCRLMAQDTVDVAVKNAGLQAGPCRTKTTPYLGAEKYTPTLYSTLAQKYGFKSPVAHHLADSYGSKAQHVVELARELNLSVPLAQDHPYLEAEVVYAVENEYALTAVDVLARRTRLAFLDRNAAEAALPRVIDLMAAKLAWDAARQQRELDDAKQFLATMHAS